MENAPKENDQKFFKLFEFHLKNQQQSKRVLNSLSLVNKTISNTLKPTIE